jgi:hypothetical protein
LNFPLNSSHNFSAFVSWPQELLDSRNALEASQTRLVEHKDKEVLYEQQIFSLKEALKDAVAEKEVVVLFRVLLPA